MVVIKFWLDNYSFVLHSNLALLSFPNTNLEVMKLANSHVPKKSNPR